MDFSLSGLWDGFSSLFSGGDSSTTPSTPSVGNGYSTPVTPQDYATIANTDYGSITPTSTSPSFWGDLGSAIASPQGVAGIVGGINSYIQGTAALDLQKKQQQKLDQAEKMKAMIEMAKLKYQMSQPQGGGGRGGGGGGSANAQKAQQLQALASQKAGINDSLSSLGGNLSAAYKR